jgi:hypothetical protein
MGGSVAGLIASLAFSSRPCIHFAVWLRPVIESAGDAFLIVAFVMSALALASLVSVVLAGRSLAPV